MIIPLKTPAPEPIGILVPIFQLRKLMLREVKKATQGHTAKKH